MRVLKLLTKGAFHSCLPSHLKTTQKIGDGGFGSVFKVTCDPRTCKHIYHSTSTSTTTLCQFLKSIQQCRSRDARDSMSVQPLSFLVNDNYKQTSISSIDTPPFSVFDKEALASVAPRTFAVKRLARERSGFDNSLIYEIFNEIGALELLAGAGDNTPYQYTLAVKPRQYTLSTHHIYAPYQHPPSRRTITSHFSTYANDTLLYSPQQHTLIHILTTLLLYLQVVERVCVH